MPFSIFLPLYTVWSFSLMTESPSSQSSATDLPTAQAFFTASRAAANGRSDWSARRVNSVHECNQIFTQIDGHRRVRPAPLPRVCSSSVLLCCVFAPCAGNGRVTSPSPSIATVKDSSPPPTLGRNGSPVIRGAPRAAARARLLFQHRSRMSLRLRAKSGRDPLLPPPRLGLPSARH